MMDSLALVFPASKSTWLGAGGLFFVSYRAAPATSGFLICTFLAVQFSPSLCGGTSEAVPFPLPCVCSGGFIPNAPNNPKNLADEVVGFFRGMS